MSEFDELDAVGGGSKKGLIVGVVVILGIAVLGVGGYLAYKKRVAPPEVTGPQKAVGQWCELRQGWARKVRPLAGDIMLKMVNDPEGYKKLLAQRKEVCRTYAVKLQELLKANPKLWGVVQPTEEALIKEGKVRANISVLINNTLTQVDAPDSQTLDDHRSKLTRTIKKRLTTDRAKFDQEISAGLAKVAVGGSCSGLYRGPMTDKGTSGDPFITWEELELQRSGAVKQFDAAIKALEPVEQYINRIYHELMTRYRAPIRKCYQKAKKKNPEMSAKMGLQVRMRKDGKLKKGGKIWSLATAWAKVREESFVDCLLDTTAAKWKLPVYPDPELETVVVTLDLPAF